VGLGDTVARGDVIAVSGNSSAPHLHFDVRIGWDLNYSCGNLSEFRTLPAFFEDKEPHVLSAEVGDSFATNNT
jgi:murein DD-endopeptidase MepM/ murein hydrolase activator NlpD